MTDFELYYKCQQESMHGAYIYIHMYLFVRWFYVET